jgi:hypothetical protein
MHVMFSHTVLLKFNRSDDEFFTRIGEYAEQLRTACEGVMQLRFVRNEASRSGGFTHGFITSFVDESAHDRYQEMPAHIELKQYIMPHVTELIVLDSTIS